MNKQCVLKWLIALTTVSMLASALYLKYAFKMENPPIENPSPGNWETSEYMIGSVAVGIIFLESNGAIDSNAEDWNATEEQNVVDKIQVALDWWASLNPDANVSFITEIHYSVPTSYEPINRTLGDMVLWISEALNYLEYRGEDWDIQRRNYVNDLRKRLNTDWAFIMFIVDASNDPDGRYADRSGATSSFGGPSLQMPFKTPRILEWLVAHEMAHIFWATDEYNGKTELSGYLNVPDDEGSDCLMRIPISGCLSGRLHGLNGTWGQVGWRDSDGDGIQDIVDTFPRIYLEPPEISQKTIKYAGVAVVTPYTNNNPIGREDVTINKIKNIEFRVDSSSWTSAIPIDGSFGDAIESFTFTEDLEPGEHFIEIKAINNLGNEGFTNQTVTIPEF